MVRELSKKVHKFTEAEKFVFTSEQSAQFFVKFSTKYLQHRLLRKKKSTEVNKGRHTLTLYLGILDVGKIWIKSG